MDAIITKVFLTVCTVPVHCTGTLKQYVHLYGCILHVQYLENMLPRSAIRTNKLPTVVTVPVGFADLLLNM